MRTVLGSGSFPPRRDLPCLPAAGCHSGCPGRAEEPPQLGGPSPFRSETRGTCFRCWFADEPAGLSWDTFLGPAESWPEQNAARDLQGESEAAPSPVGGHHGYEVTTGPERLLGSAHPHSAPNTCPTLLPKCQPADQQRAQACLRPREEASPAPPQPLSTHHKDEPTLGESHARGKHDVGTRTHRCLEEASPGAAGLGTGRLLARDPTGQPGAQGRSLCDAQRH